MSDEARHIRASRERYLDLLSEMAGLEGEFTGLSHGDGVIDGIVRWVSDGLSDADEKAAVFNAQVEEAGKSLRAAERELREKSLNAGRYLDLAQTQMRQARRFLLEFSGEMEAGAKRGEAVSYAVPAAVATGGAAVLSESTLAIAVFASAALHAGGLSIAALVAEPDDEFKDVIRFAPLPEPSPPPEEKGKREDEEENVCAPAMKFDGESSDVDFEPCGSPEEMKERGGRIVRALREPRPKRVVTKDTGLALAKEAEAALAEWKGGGKKVHDLGAFLLKSEAAGRAPGEADEFYAAMKKKWDALVERVREEAAKCGAVEEKAAAVVGLLKSDFDLRFYMREKALMTDLFSCGGGNCEAETKFIIAALIAAGIEMPEGKRLGIQLFEDHMQAVIYDSASDEITDLLTNTTTKRFAAPVYDPHYLFRAYLRSHPGYGVESPVGLDELLIRNYDEGDLQSGDRVAYVTNTDLICEGGAGFFSNGDVPEFAILGEDGTGAYGGTGTMPSGAEPSIVEASDHMRERRLPFDSGPGWVSFMEASVRDKYLALPTVDEKRRFLISLAVERLEGIMTSEEQRAAIAFLSDPAGQMARISPDAISKIASTIKEIEPAISNLGASMGHMVPLPYSGEGYDTVQQHSHMRFIEAELYARYPMLRTMKEKLISFNERATSHPVEFILFMDRVDRARRLAFIDLLDAYEGSLFQSVGPVKQALADKKKIGIGIRAGYKPMALIPVAFIGDGDPKPELPEKFKLDGTAGEDDRESTGRRGRKARADDDGPGADVTRDRISVRTFFDLLFNLPDYHQDFPPASRWTPEMASEFRRLNRDGRYDDQFQRLSYKLAQRGPNGTMPAEIEDILEGIRRRRT